MLLYFFSFPPAKGKVSSVFYFDGGNFIRCEDQGDEDR